MTPDSETLDLIIVGAGKYGREVHGFARDVIRAGTRWRIKGFLDDRSGALAGFDYPTPIIGTPDTYVPQPSDRFLCSVGDNELRHKYVRMIADRGGKFATLIHPSASVNERAVIGPGTIVEPFAFIGADVTIGEHCLIGAFSCVSHDNHIGSYCQLCGHCTFGGNVTAGDFSFFALGTVVIPQVKIGHHGFVGAGSVVLAQVAPGTRVFGNPATVVGKRTPPPTT